LATSSRIHYAWIIVAATFLTSVITSGILGIAGVLLVPLKKEFSWSASDISSAFGIRLALFGLLGPFSAAMMNRFGIRRMVNHCAVHHSHWLGWVSCYDHSLATLLVLGPAYRHRNGSHGNCSERDDCYKVGSSSEEGWFPAFCLRVTQPASSSFYRLLPALLRITAGARQSPSVASVPRWRWASFFYLCAITLPTSG
jgi:hypothetical protein